MNDHDIQLLEATAQRFVDYMMDYEGTSLGFYYKFSRATKRYQLNSLLRRIEDRLLKAGHEPIFTLETYIATFENPNISWYLARDLIAIKMRELIYHNRQHFDLGELPEDEVEAEETIEEVEE